jgi:hypothetical protein
MLPTKPLNQRQQITPKPNTPNTHYGYTFRFMLNMLCFYCAKQGLLRGVFAEKSQIQP